MSIEQEIAGLTQSTTDLLDAVNTKKATLDTAVSNAQTAVVDATSQVSLAAAEKVGAQSARDEAETHKNLAYTYSQSAASAVAYQDLTAIAESKAETAVDVFVYDTRKDSDGGAWRQRTQGTSWYNETLNTITRGSRKEFPAVAVIVAEANKVTIYDGDDPSLPMWMVFNGGGTAGSFNLLNGTNLYPKSLNALNGILSIGVSPDGDYPRFYTVSFVSDSSNRYTSGGVSPYLGSISERNAYKDMGDSDSNGTIVSSNVNDIAMTVLPNAPIDPATGLPIPTIAVATEGGVSVIKDDGTVVDSVSTVSAYAKILKVGFTGSNKVTAISRTYDSTGYYRLSIFDIPITDVTYSAFVQDADYTALTVPKLTVSPAAAANKLHVASLGSDIAYGYQTVSNVLHLIKPDVIKANGLVAGITSTYNTGWMNGDIKLATLSDTDDTDLVATELVTNGTFDTDTTGWTENSGTVSVTSGQVTIASPSDGTRGHLYQSLTTVAGKAYVLSIDNISLQASGDAKIQVSNGLGIDGSNFIDLDEWTTAPSVGTNFYTFVATGTTTYLHLLTKATNAASVTYDNISLRLAEADRSVNDNGLQVFGTVQKNPVATGADLVAYSGFSAINYLQQPYNPDLDFGTGDFCVMGWVKIVGHTGSILDRGNGIDTANRLQLHIYNNTVRMVTAGTSVVAGGSVVEGVWSHVSWKRKDGIGVCSLNGVTVATGTCTDNISGTFPVNIGVSHFLSGEISGSLALLRISATAPTAEQIAKIYRDEKPLFQENAQATLHGTSDAVTALAYDDTTELLHVGTSAGRSVFSGLQRVDNTTDAVGTAISASDNFIAEE